MNSLGINTLIVWLTLLVMLLINSCSFSSKTTRRLFKESANEQYDLIIVPGVPFENGTWSRVMKGRVYWSKYLYDKGIAKNIMYSGNSVYTPYYEAEIMAMYAEAIGIPKANIYTETKAEHSTENVYYSYKKAKKLGFSKIALATDPFQAKLLRRFTREKVSPDVKLIPFVVDTLRTIEPDMVDPVINPEQAFNKNFVSITTRQTFWQRFRGTRGLTLDTTAYR